MTILTNDGREYLDDLRYGRVSESINALAVGTGDAPESIEDSELDNEVYRSHVDNSNVRFTKVPNYPSATYAAIDLHGGTEVPAGTQVSELAVVVDEEDTLVFRDVKAPVVIEAGLEVTLRLRIDVVRGQT